VALARLKEHPDLSEWGTVISRIAARAFCRGENDSGWTADFAYLTRVETFDDHLTGKFSNPTPQKAKRFDPGRNVGAKAWHADDVREYGGDPPKHQRWDEYLDFMADKPGPWPRFAEWLKGTT